ncbi:MAG TPA: flagellar M-ring protein FliF, partial [Sphingomonas sp.]|nr:flagellar M-ring protein FliF [Sphingomonas sp.]
SRNDQVTVISRKFAGAAEASKPAWYDAGWFPVMARNLTALIIALLVIFVGLKPLLKMFGKKRDAAAAAEGATTVSRPPVSVAALEQAQGYEDKVKLVRDFTRDNPARAALAVRDMIRSEEKAGA